MGYIGEDITELRGTLCRGCKAPIKFIKLARGKMHPVNPEPKCLWVLVAGAGYCLRECYESHFATCPKAAEFRKKS